MEEAVIRIGIDSGNSNKTLGEIKQELDEINAAGKTATNSTAAGIDKVTNSSTNLKAQLRQMKAELANLPEGSAEFRNLAAAAGEVQDRLTMVNNSIRSLADNKTNIAFETLAQSGQAVAGGFQAAQGAMALFGSNSAAVEKAVQNVIAVQGIMNGVMSVNNALQDDSILGIKLRAVLSKVGLALTREEAVATNTKTVGMMALSAATAVYNTVVGTSTGLMKVFRLALLSTGVGALIVGLGLLIANFSKVQKWVGTIINGFKALGDAIMAVAEFFGFVEKGTVANMQAERKQQEERRKATAENTKRHEQKVAQIKKERDEFIAAKNKEINAMNLQLDTLEAEGKATEAIRLQILKAERDKVKAVVDANRAMLQSKLDTFEAEAKIQGMSNEEFAKSIGLNFQESFDMYSNLLKGQEDALQKSENKITKFNREQSEKRQGIAQAAADKQKAIDDKLAADKLAKDQKAIEDQAKIEKEISDRKIEEKNNYIAEVEKLETDYYDSLLSDQQREENAVREKYFNLIEQAKQYGEDYSLLVQAQDAELALITEGFAKKAAEKQIEDNLKRIAAQQEYAENIIAGATAVVNIIDSINTIANKKEIDRIKKKQEAGEKLSKREENKLKRDIAMQKAFAIAKIAIDTASALTSAISGAAASAAAAGPAAVAFTPVFIATQIATVLGAVGSALAILNAPAPTIGGGGAGAGGMDDPTEGEPDPTPPDTELFKTGQSILNQPPMKVYVLEQDISDTQSNVAQIKQQATFG
jgi:hypothetical protein